MSAIRGSGNQGEAGFTLIDMLFVIALIGLLSTLAIPGLMRAKGAAQAASALGTIRVVNGAQLSYAITCGLGFYAPDFKTLGLRPPGTTEPYLAPEMASGPTFIKSAHLFSMAGVAVPGAPGSCNGLGMGLASSGYAVVADPLTSVKGVPYFASNADGIIYEDSATFSATMPESGPPPSGAPIH